MFEFLRQYYERGRSDEIGGLLGGLSLLDDGNPADPAMQNDFEKALAVVLTAESTVAGYRGADFQIGDGEQA
jgi:hypothetical protein